ncbi:uncharacterized protein LOC110887977 [Helianthus annuus]|uniref:uncharacterized protein LOC110887977 n=1 Tax=Helianthus annuus TaxID=4232 RepID=UPI000B9002EB|nr:uncharacterized protein LOC110887977 [Helianthus annuus]
MLNDEVIRQAAHQQQSSSVLVTTSNPNSTTQTQQPSHAAPSTDNSAAANNSSYQSNSRGRGRGYRGNHGRGGHGRGYRGNPTGPPWQFQNHHSYPQWAWWNTPPCPYPTTATGRPNPPQPNVASHYTTYSGQPSYGPVPLTFGYDALSPSDLHQAFNTMQLNYTEPYPVMDTGAERHATENRGMIQLPNPFPITTKLLVGNGKCLPIEGSGTGYLPMHNRTYILPNILYSPQII